VFLAHRAFQEWEVTNESQEHNQVKIAIISEAASTGISLHSSNESANKLPRLHVILEAPWTATSTSQQMGRSHRANQAHYPAFLIPMSDIPGEARFASALAARMESLGALCKGDRNSAHGAVWKKYEVSRPTAKQAIREVVNAIFGNESILNLFENEKRAKRQEQLQQLLWDMQCVRVSAKKEKVIAVASMTNHEKFLNRVLCLSVSTQSELLGFLETAIERIGEPPAACIQGNN